jgi:hypothetical protein
VKGGEDMNYDGFDEPVRTEPLRDYDPLRDYANKPVWEKALSEVQAETRQKRERAEALAREIRNSGSELGGPHVLETMRGLLGEI